MAIEDVDKYVEFLDPESPVVQVDATAVADDVQLLLVRPFGSPPEAITPDEFAAKWLCMEVTIRDYDDPTHFYLGGSKGSEGKINRYLRSDGSDSSVTFPIADLAANWAARTTLAYV